MDFMYLGGFLDKHNLKGVIPYDDSGRIGKFSVNRPHLCSIWFPKDEKSDGWTITSLSASVTRFFDGIRGEGMNSFVRACISEIEERDEKYLHLIHKDKHWLISIVHGADVLTLHISESDSY